MARAMSEGRGEIEEIVGREICLVAYPHDARVTAAAIGKSVNLASPQARGAGGRVAQNSSP
jgi:hypothetical protein